MQHFLQPQAPFVISLPYRVPRYAPPKHGIRHHLQTQPGPPVFAKSRHLDPEKLEIARLEFSAMEKAGIVRRSCSPWSSPLHMVRKKDGGWRPCGDYQRLKIVTIPDRNPLPNIADFTSVWMVPQFFPNWIYRKDSTRFLCLPLTSRGPPSSPPLVCSSSSGFLLA